MYSTSISNLEASADGCDCKLTHLAYTCMSTRACTLQGRVLKPGDQLPIGHVTSQPAAGLSVPSAWQPSFPSKGKAWEVGVLPGPNGAPDYFTEEDIDTLHSATYTVHYNS